MSRGFDVPFDCLGVGVHPSAIYLTCLGPPVYRVGSDRGKICRMRALEWCNQVEVRDGAGPEACSKETNDTTDCLIAQDSVVWSLSVKLQGVGNLTMIYRTLQTVDEQ